MSQFEKALSRLQKIPSDYEWDEAVRVFKYYGYELDTSGGGSHTRFINKNVKSRIFCMPKPHKKGGKATIKECYLKEMIRHLKENDFI